MPWARFTDNFDWSPRYGVTTAYKAGMVLNVTRRCRDAAVAARKAVAMTKASRDADPVEVSADGA